MDTLGQKIRSLRKENNLTQQALADGIVTPSMISQIESDRAIPSEILLRHISRRLNVSVEYFETDVLDKSDELQSYRLARHLMDRGRYEEALQILRSLTWPLSPQFKPDVVYNELANCCVQTGRLEEAWKMYEGVVRVGYDRGDVPTCIHAYHNMGLTLRRLGKDRIARMYWQRASDLLDQHAHLHMPVGLRIAFQLGRLYLTEGNWERARQAYERALSIFNQHGGSLDLAKTYHGLSCACAELNDYDEALQYNDRAIVANREAENYKGALHCRINRGVILRQANRYQDAHAYLRDLRAELTEKESTLLQALLHETTVICYTLQNFDQALSDSEDALSMSGIMSSAATELRLIRARIYLNRGLMRFALKETTLGLEMGDDSVPAFVSELCQIARECKLALGHEQDVLEDCLKAATKILDSTSKKAIAISA